MSNQSGAQKLVNWEDIKYGAVGYQRYRAQAIYCKAVIRCCGNKWKAVDSALRWNRLNKPLLPPEYIVGMVCGLWEYRYGKRPRGTRAEDVASYFANEAVPGYEVDRNLQDIERLTQDDWLLEPGEECTTWRRIIRESNHYESLPIPCGELTCPWCANPLREKLIIHLVGVAEKGKLYFRHIEKSSWLHVQGIIEEQNGDYVVINTKNTAVFTDKPMQDAILVPGHVAKELLEKSIPSLHNGVNQPTPNICTSPGWTPLLDEPDVNGKVVIKTMLPLYRQQEAAAGLGAKSCGHNEWEAPPDANQAEWECKFTSAVEFADTMFREALKHLEETEEGFAIKKARHEIDVIDINYSFYDTQPSRT